MKYLFISRTGGTLSLAMQVSGEGHQAVLMSEPPIGTGLATNIPFVASVYQAVRQNTPDVVVFDDANHGRVAERLRKDGYRTICASRWSQVLHTNPIYGESILRGLGLQKPPATNNTYFIIEGWFNGNKFITATLSINYSTLFCGDVGPKVKSMGTVTYCWLKRKDELHKQTLGKLEPHLRKSDYRGPITLEVALNGADLYGSSITAQPSLTFFAPLLEGTKTTVTDVINSLLSGSDFNVKTDEWVVSVAISIPPWPYDYQPTHGRAYIKLGGINDKNLRHIWFNDIGRNGTNNYFCTATSGFLGYVTGRGRNHKFIQENGSEVRVHGIDEARRRVYRTISNLKIPQLQYRIDIGESAKRVFNNVRINGWIT